MLHVNISNSFKDTSINTTLTLSLETTLEYAIADVIAVVCPPATNLLFSSKFPIHIDVKYHVHIEVLT